MNINQVDNLNQMRMIAQASLEQKNIPDLIDAALRNRSYLPSLNEAEEIMFKIRTELINYINEAGIVHGFVWDGNDWPIENGKIVISKEMIYDVVKKFEFLDADEVTNLVNNMFDAQFVVRDENYVHTDNNFTDEDVAKLGDIESGAEVNKVIDVQVDGSTVLDPSTRVANITKEEIKTSYESNDNTNVFTDAEKEKLSGISSGAEVNRVDDVFVDSRSVLNERKQAIITKEIIKESYESNDNTNAFTDAEKEAVENHTEQIEQMEAEIEAIHKKDESQDGEITTIKNDLGGLGDQVNDNANIVGKLKGGAASQVLAKKTDSDYDVEWIDPPKSEVIKKYDQNAYRSITTGPGSITDKFTYKVIQVGDVAFFYFLLYGTHYPVKDYQIDITELIDPSKVVGTISQNAQLSIYTKEKASQYGEALTVSLSTSDRIINPNKITISFYSSDSSGNIEARGCGMVALPLYDA